jgi:hypothetical protein
MPSSYTARPKSIRAFGAIKRHAVFRFHGALKLQRGSNAPRIDSDSCSDVITTGGSELF